MAAVTILGAGSWGTALGADLARIGHEVTLWERNPEFAARLAAVGENPIYRPGVCIPPGLKPLGSLEEACSRAEDARLRLPVVGDQGAGGDDPSAAAGHACGGEEHALGPRSRPQRGSRDADHGAAAAGRRRPDGPRSQTRTD